ncbi:MAG: hypothetical protein FWD39_02310 [Clostridiales bacterium]|nr:hypothetical protein [Clostridiales bacterium]
MISEMIAKLSKRERVMLYGLALLLLIVGSYYFLIKPTVDSHTKAADEVAALRDEKIELQIRRGDLLVLRTDVKKYGRDLKDKDNGFKLYTWKSDYELDSFLTDELLKQHGLHPVSLTLGAPGWIALPEVYKARFLSSTEKPPASDWQIRAVEVNVVCQGSMEDFLSLAAACNQLDWISLSSVLMNSGDDTNGFALRFTVFFDDGLRGR